MALYIFLIQASKPMMASVTCQDLSGIFRVADTSLSVRNLIQYEQNVLALRVVGGKTHSVKRTAC